MHYYLAELEYLAELGIYFPKIIMMSDDLDTCLLNRKNNQIILKDVILLEDKQPKVDSILPSAIEE